MPLTLASTSFADGDYLAFLRLLLGRVGDIDSARTHLSRVLCRFDYYSVSKWLVGHLCHSYASRVLVVQSVSSR